jgi:hypothetical protein
MSDPRCYRHLDQDLRDACADLGQRGYHLHRVKRGWFGFGAMTAIVLQHADSDLRIRIELAGAAVRMLRYRGRRSTTSITTVAGDGLWRIRRGEVAAAVRAIID